ncbi:MAG: DUF4423 domain-containing protein [Bdellovibrionales bacterium]|nr:DUF4423 domain-containing protein [Bdellovibrionales bacterium]
MASYEFEDFKDFFSYEIRERLIDSKGRKRATLQRLAQKLGYSSPSILSMLAKGTRLPSEKMLDALFDEWNIDKRTQRLIRLKVNLERQSKKGQPIGTLLDQLVHLESSGKYRKIDLNQFQMIREWYNLVIRALVGAPGFCEDPKTLSLRLRRKASPSQIRSGIESMLRLGVLKRDPVSQALVHPQDDLESPNDLPSEAIREHHRGMIHRALEAIDEQGPETRQLSAATLCFDVERIEEEKKHIHGFVRDFNERFGTSNSPRAFQVNVQFF